MARASIIPKSATLERRVRFLVLDPEAERKGKVLELRLYSAQVSDGFKSDYQHHAAKFVLFIAEGEKPFAHRYSGRYLAQADRQLEVVASMALAGKVQILEN